MILDATGRLASAQAAITSGVSDHWMDIGTVLRDLGTGRPLWFDFHITTSYTVAVSPDDLNSINFAIVLTDNVTGTIVSLLGASQDHFNIGGEVSDRPLSRGTTSTSRASRCRTGRSGISRRPRAAGFPLLRLRALHTVTNSQGDGFATGAYSCTLLSDPPSRVFGRDYANGY